MIVFQRSTREIPMRSSFAFPFVLALGACASQPPEQTRVAAVETTPQGAELQCHKEAALGSNMIHTVCEKKLSDAEQAQVQEAISNKLHEMQRTTLPKGN
jgi:hypothetical protein